MTYLNILENKIKEHIKEAGYDLKTISLEKSRMKELGDYQINDAMKLAKEYKENPHAIAEKIIDVLKKDTDLVNINVAGPGFINFSISNQFLLNFLNSITKDLKTNLPKKEPKKIIIDYGGANVAKILHVGHLRSANIGEALKRLAQALGNTVIGDVHLGDSGSQAGQVVLELKKRFPDLPCFQDNYHGEDFELPIKLEDLNEIYPLASSKSKEDLDFKEEAAEITYLIQKDHLGYKTIWNKVKDLSLIEIKDIYKKLNTSFDLWEGELDSYKEIPEVLAYLEKKKLTYLSEGALVMDVEDNKPPLILVKSNGAYIYETTDLATIYSRIKRFQPDEIWYLTDKRQAFHFEQVFAGAKKSQIVTNESLRFFPFGTMNGQDKKPFKTRDGGVMTLKELLQIVNDKCLDKVSPSIQDKKSVAQKVSIGALKYSDLLPFRETDYIFNLDKFSDLEGKTGPYILYSVIRIKSLLKKNKEKFSKATKIKKSDRAIYLNLLNMPAVIDNAYETKSLSDICEYLYDLASSYNYFYGENHILTEKDSELKESWLTLSKVTMDTLIFLLDVLAIEVPEAM